jgi:hypothetical protein
LSSVATPNTKIPLVRQPSLSTAQHTVILDKQRLETSNPGTVPVAHSPSTASMLRTQPSTSQTTISNLTRKGRPALSSLIYPYFLPPDYFMQYRMQTTLTIVQLSMYNIFTSLTSDIRAGLLPNRTPSLKASLQVMYTFSGATGADVRLNQSQPVVVTMDKIRTPGGNSWKPSITVCH